MKILGIILAGLITGFVIVMPAWDVIVYSIKIVLGLIAGSIFYTVWTITFPAKHDKLDWEK